MLPFSSTGVEGQRRDSKSSQRRDSKLIASPDKARGTAAAFEVHGEKWGHGGKPGKGVTEADDCPILGPLGVCHVYRAPCGVM